ncbi:uncharacterized protein PAC_16770 [Phialocephala subalpina]|uniref:Uncharacterized protein n=1 Tax=Phialocephala subalpina TaxID=576137 RepID=A0A1L7XPB1_9HELO|nr:uncharacterized protein PAC_16770 [Phialocephala subalpina]
MGDTIFSWFSSVHNSPDYKTHIEKGSSRDIASTVSQMQGDRIYQGRQIETLALERRKEFLMSKLSALSLIQLNTQVTKGTRRRLFSYDLGQQRLIGLAPALAQERDFICILQGAKVPFIVRRTEEPGRFWLANKSVSQSSVKNIFELTDLPILTYRLYLSLALRVLDLVRDGHFGIPFLCASLGSSIYAALESACDAAAKLDSLLLAGADSNATSAELGLKHLFSLLSDKGINILVEAVAWGDMTIVRRLIQRGAEMNEPGRESSTSDDNNQCILPLTAAIRHGRWNVVEYLLSRGAEADNPPEIFLSETPLRLRFPGRRRISNRGHVALLGAIKKRYRDMVEVILRSKIVDINKHPRQFSDFFVALGLNKTIVFGSRCLIQATGDPLQSPLQLAVDLEDIRITKLLLSHGADPNASTNPGYAIRDTPLQFAAENGHNDMVELLIEYGANVNHPAAESHGATTLQSAANKGYLGITSLLLEHGAEVDAPGAPPHGWTAPEKAAAYGRIDMVQLRSMLERRSIIVQGRLKIAGRVSSNWRFERFERSNNMHIGTEVEVDMRVPQQRSTTTANSPGNKGSSQKMFYPAMITLFPILVCLNHDVAHARNLHVAVLSPPHILFVGSRTSCIRRIPLHGNLMSIILAI